MPNHSRYVEPFCGSAAVFTSKQKVKSEVLNDIDSSIVQFFTILRDKPDALINFIKFTPYSFELYQRIRKKYYNQEYADDPVQRAAEFYFLRYAEFGAGHKNGFARDGKSMDRCRAKTFKNHEEKLQRFADRLKDAVIENKDYEFILEYYDSPDTLFYCDPPYKGTEYNYASKTFEHERLQNILSNIQGKFILSYDHKIDKHRFCCVSKKAKYQVNAAGRENTQYLYMNYDPKNTTMFSDSTQTNLEEWR